MVSALKKLQEQIAAWPMTQRFVVQQLIAAKSDFCPHCGAKMDGGNS